MLDQLLSPDDIEVPKMIRWNANHTCFRLCTPSTPAVEPGHYAMMSQYVPPQQESEFVMLSTSPALLYMGEKRMMEELDKE